MGRLFKKNQPKPARERIPAWSATVCRERDLVAAISLLSDREHERINSIIEQIESEHSGDGKRWKALAGRIKSEAPLLPTLQSLCDQFIEGRGGEAESERWTYMDNAKCTHCGKRYPIRGGKFEMELLRHVSTERNEWGTTTRAKYRCGSCKKEVGVIREKNNFD